MSSIVICSIPAHGHVTPLLSVAKGFVERGDDVRFITGRKFADKVTAVGASFMPLPEEADFDDASLFDQFPQRAKLKGTKAIAFDVEHVFARPSTAQYHALMAALSAKPADVVLADPLFLGAAFLLEQQRRDRPAVIMCGIVPVCFESLDSAPFGMGLPPARFFNRQRNTVLAAIHRRLLRQSHQVIETAYHDVHGTQIPFTLTSWSRHTDAYVQFSVPSFEYPMSDAPPNLYFAGPLTATSMPTPLPDWWPDLDGPRPVVHVTQGTVANLDYGQVIAPTLRALADEDVLIVVSTGGRPLDSLPPLPANARAATYLPYDELLPRTAVYVTNGGYGGVQHALRYGVPVVATGGKEDKPEVGARVAWSGAGHRIRSEHPTPRDLHGAIHAVLNDSRYRRASERIRAEMAISPGFAGLAALVDKLAQTPCTPTTPAGSAENDAPHDGSVVA
ncbi:glycosyltransferase [Mycobacterium sp. OTB74]|uniref:glycosyltransferase n=1 Tax=Mycobacterium sp. OTB74 TaxID=1853452 RepID=UPI002473CFEF|nr:glycosyltransferase [Mycobacterium sp. OTB74]MDH6242627.1 MGT family glycosyltransferase [Mycobacterium sp. OTB74]